MPLIDLNGLGHFKDKENEMIAADYSASKTYPVGSYVYYNGVLYRCTTAITTAEAWTSGHWTAAKLADDLNAQSEAITELSTAITQEFAWAQGTLNTNSGSEDGVTSTSNTKITRIRTYGFIKPLSKRGYVTVKSGYQFNRRCYDRAGNFVWSDDSWFTTSDWFDFDLDKTYRFVAGKTNGDPLKPEDEPITITYSVAYDSVVENNYYNRHERNPIMQSKYSDSNRKSLALLHYSDIHASLYSMQDIQNFYNRNADLIDDIINTGDTAYYYVETQVNGNPVSEFSPQVSYQIGDYLTYSGYVYQVTKAFSGIMKMANYCKYYGATYHVYSFNKYFQMPLGEKSLYVLGNHDTCVANYTGVGDESYDYDGMAKATAVSTYYSNIANWNVTRPSNDVCYYYKDYADQKIRLICLDVQYWDATELSWLESTLAGAITAGYSVVIAAHCVPDELTGYTDTNFTNYSAPDYSDSYGSYYGAYTLGDAVSAIETFIGNGGEFICWLCGHNHRNRFAKCTNSTNITVVQIENAGNFNSSSHYNDRTDNNVFSRTCANVISFNTNDKLIKITRFGTNMDAHMRVADYLCFDYANKQLIV